MSVDCEFIETLRPPATLCGPALAVYKAQRERLGTAAAPGRPRRPLCVYEREVVEPCRTCAGDEARHRRRCVHPTATLEPNDTGGAYVPHLCTYAHVANDIRDCDSCEHRTSDPPRPAAAGPMRFVRTADLVAAAVALAGKLPPDTAGVVGVPRSGMIPAAVVATHLHLPLYELADDGPRLMGGGARGLGLGYHRATGPLAVVDDTVYAGAAMRRARAVMAGRPAVYAAALARPEAAGEADLYGGPLPCPHLLEWNLFNCGVTVGDAANPVFGRGVATDLDGVVLHDSDSGGPVGSPYLVPRAVPVPLICTGRPESSRAVTEAQLRAAGARWDRLEMLPDGVPQTPGFIAEHKAGHYRASGCGFFVESDPVQARLVFEATGKPVACPIDGKVYQQWPVTSDSPA